MLCRDDTKQSFVPVTFHHQQWTVQPCTDNENYRKTTCVLCVAGCSYNAQKQLFKWKGLLYWCNMTDLPIHDDLWVIGEMRGKKNSEKLHFYADALHHGRLSEYTSNKVSDFEIIKTLCKDSKIELTVPQMKRSKFLTVYYKFKSLYCQFVDKR